MAEQESKDTITVIRPPDAPMAPISETICLADMTQVERERFADKLGCKKFKSHVSDCNKRGLYELAKRDICKEAKEAREKEEQEKSKELETLKERNKVLLERSEILENHARKQENDFNDYKKLTNLKIEKMAILLQSLIENLK